MQYFGEGLLFGLGLAFSMGPIFIVITQTSIQRGWKAGLSVGFGIWFSDILYILASYIFTQSIADTLVNEKVKFWSAMAAALVLFVFGLYLILSKNNLEQEEIKLNAKNFAQYFSRGFVVNGLNPFTPIFWFGITPTYIIGRGLNLHESLWWLGGIMIMIIFSDAIKIFLAQMIRTKLSERHMKYIAFIAGFSLILIAGFLIYQAFYPI